MAKGDANEEEEESAQAADQSLLEENNTKETSADKDDNESVEESTPLTEDIYSVMIMARARSGAFVFAIFVFMFQMTLIVLISLDLTDGGTENPFEIPPSVNIEVTIAQALAIVLAVATQGDLLTAIIQLHDGYDKRFQETNPAFTFSKWLFSSLAQFLIGAGMLTLIFILIIQSRDVIGMMLNFAALSFLSEIDDVAFMLAKNGFVSDSVEQECKQVSECHFPMRKRKSKWFRRVLFVLILAGLMAGWGYVVDLQRAGTFIPDAIFVQFGDAYDPLLSSFSGRYDFGDELHNRRGVYWERRSGLAYFAYCTDEQAWTFSTLPSFGPCGTWNVSSPETKVYDVTKAGAPWIVSFAAVDERIFKDPIDLFSMFDGDCTDCNGFGKCINNQCECEGDRYGRNCEFHAPCDRLTVDMRTDPFPTDEAPLSETYTLLRSNETGKLVQVYDRPVYVFDLGDGLVDIIMFLGRRWIVTDTSTFFDWDGDNVTRIFFTDLAEVATHLSNNFHGYFNGFRSYFISAAQDTGTPTDITGTPIDLQWFRVKQSNLNTRLSNEADERKPIETNLLCSSCVPNVNECINLGECDETTGTCTCKFGFFGDLCEAAAPCNDVGCHVNGTCNEDSGICDCPEGFGGDLCEVNITQPQ